MPRRAVCLTKAILVATVLAGSALAQQRSLIVNGSFEDGPEPRSFTNIPGGTTSIRGWVVTGEGIDYIGGLWVASEGKRSLDLDGSAHSKLTPPYSIGGIAQTFATKPGARYVVTFDLAGNPFNQPLVKELLVSAAGQKTEFSFDIKGKNGRVMGWTPQRWMFTANATSTTLEFRSLAVSPKTGFGPAIDNVAVVEAQAPRP